MSDDPPRSASMPSGYDEQDPYEDEDLDQYPAWWRENVAEFRRHGLRPYRPARFTDGVPVPEVVEGLEASHDVTVRVRAINPHDRGDWRFEVDGTVVASVSRFRHADGYSVYEVSSSTIESIVEEHL